MEFRYIVYVFLFVSARCYNLPGSCKGSEYLEFSSLVCHSCPINASMITSNDGLSCTCEDHSVPVKPSKCKLCGATEVVSSDGKACVPRRCQSTNGRTVCRKCPADYISVTQNFDGSPMKELLCVRCARGFKAANNACVKCPSCACARNEVAVREACVPKNFVTTRPKYEGSLHPMTILDVVKFEYLCIEHDYKACRALASECIKNFYTTEVAGPCRLWIQPNLVPHKGLPKLVIETSPRDNNPAEIDLARGKDTIKLALGVDSLNGGFQILQQPSEALLPCFLPLEITIGQDLSRDCHLNNSELFEAVLSPFVIVTGDLRPIPVALKKPSGYYIQRSTWPTDLFRFYFVAHDTLLSTNVTSLVYLRTLLIRMKMLRSKSSLRVQIAVEAEYATKSFSQLITTTLRVQHEMPNAGVLRGLEIWGGIFGAFLSCYAIIQWRGVMRRGGLQISLVPLLAGSVSDAIYFAVLISTLHALAAEAGAFGLTLPPSNAEERIIRAFVYSAISLKVIKVSWINWQQCCCDIFFLDWSEYNSSVKEEQSFENNMWRTKMVAQEWSRMQSKRRVSPGFTVPLALLVLHLLSPWQNTLPHSPGYIWAVGTIAWWCAYAALLLARWVKDRLMGSPSEAMSRVCNGVGISLLVFEEECYAHYIHGRNNGSPDAKMMAGPLDACRVACSPQLRVIYQQLSSPGLGSLDDNNSRHSLLSRFLAAFFERALDGMSWVASERTLLERLLDVEINVREAGNTSSLLYDPDDNTPSCFTMSWWGQEWTLATLDAMLFGAILLFSGDWLLSAVITLILWQLMKQARARFGDMNLKKHIGIDTLK